MRPGRRTLVVIGVIVLYFACGLLFAHTERVSDWRGLYCATANAMTEGDCNVNPTTWVGYVVNTVEHVALVAVAGGVLALFTTRLTSALVKDHVSKSEDRIKQHIEDRIRHHMGKGGAS